MNDYILEHLGNSIIVRSLLCMAQLPGSLLVFFTSYGLAWSTTYISVSSLQVEGSANLSPFTHHPTELGYSSRETSGGSWMALDWSWPLTLDPYPYPSLMSCREAVRKKSKPRMVKSKSLTRGSDDPQHQLAYLRHLLQNKVCTYVRRYGWRVRGFVTGYIKVRNKRDRSVAWVRPSL